MAIKVVGVLAASFSLRDEEPNPCNQRLAEETFRICDELLTQGYLPVVVAQWEIDLALRELRTARGFGRLSRREALQKNITVYAGSIGQYDDGRYLGTKELLDEAMPLFKEYGATRFVGVANPFIHQPYLYWLARGTKLKLMWRRVRWIGFDRQSTQWWCRSWWQFAFQTIRLALGVTHGHDGRQAQA